MSKKIINIFFIIFLFIFIIFITSFYFSEENVRLTNKTRSIYPSELKNKIRNLPLLKNDTNDIIEYRNDIEVYKKKKKKYTFWDLVGK